MSTFYKGFKGSRRSVDSNLNLVPLIDLFSTVILFLLATAVFDKVAALPLTMGEKKQDIKKSDGDGAVQLKAINANIKVIITKTQLLLYSGTGVKRVKLVEDQEDYPEVDEFLSVVRTRYPDKEDFVIAASDKSKYKVLVSVIDKCLGKKFDEIVVSGGG